MTTVLAAQAAPTQTTFRPGRALDLRATVGVIARGPADPTQLAHRGVIWRAVRTSDGPSTLALRQMADGSVRAAAWGAGSAEALALVPDLCGARDDDAGFDASRHPLIARAHARSTGMRLTRTNDAFTALAQAISEQKVTVAQAFRAWRSLVTRFGDRAPGPTPRPMFAPPAPQVWRRVPSWALHRAGLEPPQARTLVQAAARAATLATALDAAEHGVARDRILTALPGVGPWTAAETRIRAYGDSDAVSVGDYHLAHQVGYALTGSRTDDDGMLELLEPWRGHRQRVIRLILASGVREPRRGPRLHVEDHRAR